MRLLVAAPRCPLCNHLSPWAAVILPALQDAAPAIILIVGRLSIHKAQETSNIIKVDRMCRHEVA